jgi:hypothetical protein
VVSREKMALMEQERAAEAEEEQYPSKPSTSGASGTKRVGRPPKGGLQKGPRGFQKGSR